MKSQYVIVLFLFITAIIMAGTRGMSTLGKSADTDTVGIDSLRNVVDSMARATERLMSDTTAKDSLASDTLTRDDIIRDSIQRAIDLHNKAIDDSIAKDSINKSRSKGISSPVHYQSEDSMVYLASTKKAYLFGSANVKYENMTLDAEKVDMSNETILIHATG